ncbi:MAG: IPT/TIG domain-containing protein [Spirillospora sp.]
MAESPVGSEYARTRDIVVVFVVLMVLTAVLVIVLVQAWPPGPRAVPGGGAEITPVSKTLHLAGWSPVMSRETSLFVVVMAAGALGSIAHVLRSFYWYVGNRALRRSWLMMYLLLPFVGALFGLVVYLVVRGGLTSPLGGPSDINPYGVTAIAALVGQFSRETAEKFRAVFSVLLAPAQAGRDHAPVPTISGMEPVRGPAGSAVTVHGSGLAAVTAVRFGGVRAAVTDATDTLVRTTVPAGATSGPLIVNAPDGTAVSPEPFTVE